MWCKERIKWSHWIYFIILHQRILACTTEKRDLVFLSRTFLKHKAQNRLYYNIKYKQALSSTRKVFVWCFTLRNGTWYLGSGMHRCGVQHLSWCSQDDLLSLGWSEDTYRSVLHGIQTGGKEGSGVNSQPLHCKLLFTCVTNIRPQIHKLLFLTEIFFFLRDSINFHYELYLPLSSQGKKTMTGGMWQLSLFSCWK